MADITDIHTLEDGWCYFSTIMDLHSRKIIGYHFDCHMTTAIVEKALEDAVSNRNVVNGQILHTNLGSQYKSNEYEKRLKELTITHSYSREGCPYDNAGIESFHVLLKKEHVYQRPTYQTFEGARRQIFSYVQGFYNTRRIRSVLTYLSPVAFEKKYLLLNIKKLS
ncbi:IS3 family transposase [Enterococcus gilvus]|uniref:IS3 family transposase n=1 Tax=Enterococcus gilvus TaxID=160453 RepID=UPI00091A78ED|nr:IS3 family transposase [Enterococcus gilvus]OJG40579.1 hypothetical protein RV02_GL001956 [Enterococcus gilvus]